MRLSGLRLPNYACALFLVPLLAYATVTLLKQAKPKSSAEHAV